MTHRSGLSLSIIILFGELEEGGGQVFFALGSKNVLGGPEYGWCHVYPVLKTDPMGYVTLRQYFSCRPYLSFKQYIPMLYIIYIDINNFICKADIPKQRLI